jgi:GTP-binding protein
LELRLMADVGLLGLPNAGKSTFLRKVSRARPKVASYPFTTLVPSLGVCGLSDLRSFVIADLPGLVEGAAQGAGLGHRFLRHLARTRVLLHLLDPTDPTQASARAAYETLNRELRLHSPQLAERPRLVAINKIDLPDVADRIPGIEAEFRKEGLSVHPVSGATGQGVPALLEALWAAVQQAPPPAPPPGNDSPDASSPTEARADRDGEAETDET